ncbi:ATP-dependent RNA helicase HelY [Desulfotomaculum arcticum]|uniref:ATP-dependent RNA helicase HelY n=1 Tax=Desulfotruncus arcticus DSM 17038 TaxID=1121424 RepID=A0A1I2WPB8_9FIRM|nr:DEAD/DEAH box helicase [Desulfotruncus arcticus]SFH03218.1 ATP-dependent RNA helicase HelY [Desulfotomaculum arcticum] [Desulfotruncus arcticus DSM 17038]
MANSRTEEVKKILLALVPVDGTISLRELSDRAGGEIDLLASALQSLASRGEVNVFGTPEGDPEQVLLTKPGNNGAALAPTDAREKARAARLIAASMPRVRVLLRERAADSIREILTDGTPRTREELASMTHLPPRLPGAMPDVIVLPDGSYTLKGTPAGETELARRAAESSERREAMQRQRRRIDELLEEQETPLSKTELETHLGEKLLPEAIAHLMRLPDGSYAHPDSDAAWDEVGRYLSRSEPVSRQDFMRMFKRHKKLVAHIKKGREEPPFVILPNGRITVETRPEGREELRRREILAYVHYTLKEKMGGRSFFTLEDFAPRERALARQEAIHAGCVELKISKKDMFCAPIQANHGSIAAELKEITGLDFPVGKGATVPVAYIVDNSLNTREAGRALGVRPADVAELKEQGYVLGFALEGNMRYWRPSVDRLRNAPNIERLIRRSEKIKLTDAARILGLSPDQMKRIIREGYLRSAGRTVQGIHQLRRGDVEDLLARLPEIKERWGEPSGQGQERTVRRGKRRPRNRRPAPPPVNGPLKLDEYQEKSIAALEEGHSVLVAAPTGTGKTLIAERLVEYILARGKEVIYTSPIKALSNQKYRDFARLYGYDRVGLITGDVSINERASLLVMTTEIFRNWCFANPEWMSGISHVIFDEIHYLDDVERGTAWEESIIFAPPHINILGLSATVPNIMQLASWMEDVRSSKVVVVEEYRRAVPLEIRWISPDNEVLDQDEAMDEIEALRQAGSRSQYV